MQTDWRQIINVTKVFMKQTKSAVKLEIQKFQTCKKSKYKEGHEKPWGIYNTELANDRVLKSHKYGKVNE